MTHPTILGELAKARHNDFLKEAQASRLIAQTRRAPSSKSSSHRIPNRITVGLGILLVNAGERLKQEAI